jgi:hypothetical protein
VGAHVCEPTLSPFVGDVLDRLDAGQMESWQERSAVLQFDAGLSRPLAEALALIELLRRYPAILGQLQVLAFERSGGTQWLLTGDLTHARQKVSDIGGVDVGCHSVADVVHDQFGGIALLGAFG